MSIKLTITVVGVVVSAIAAAFTVTTHLRSIAEGSSKKQADLRAAKEDLAAECNALYADTIKAGDSAAFMLGGHATSLKNSAAKVETVHGRAALRRATRKVAEIRTKIGGRRGATQQADLIQMIVQIGQVRQYTGENKGADAAANFGAMFAEAMKPFCDFSAAA